MAGRIKQLGVNERAWIRAQTPTPSFYGTPSKYQVLSTQQGMPRTTRGAARFGSRCLAGAITIWAQARQAE